MIRLYEWLAGKLIVRAARLRANRMRPDDAHELRHLWAAINSGNSDGCRDGCQLDALPTPAQFPGVWFPVPFRDDMPDDEAIGA